MYKWNYNEEVTAEEFIKRLIPLVCDPYQAATAWSTHVPKANTRVLREDKVRKMLASPQWKELEMV